MENLSRRFGPKWVFRGATLDSGENGMVWLRGENGCGKSTLLRILATLSSPSEGDAWIGGSSVRSDARRARSLLHFLPCSDGGFFPRLTGRENLEAFSALRGLSERFVGDRIRMLEKELGLTEALSTVGLAASSGMRQRLSLARVLIPGDGILLLDEPFRSLDSARASAAMALLHEASKSRPVIFSAHVLPAGAPSGIRSWRIDAGSVQEAEA